MKPFLLITGMHRSGTSFLARALNLAGVYLGNLDSLISHDWIFNEDNKRGHWESKKFLELGEKTLSSNDGSWDNVPGKIFVPDNLGNEIRKTIDELLIYPSLAAGYKDPRIVLYFDSWESYLPDNIIIIGIFRHPLKVAESLKIRNNFEYEKSLHLWKIYNEKLLRLLDTHEGFLFDFDWPEKKLLSELSLVYDKIGLIKDIDISEWYSSELLKSDKTFQSDYNLSAEILDLYNKLKERVKKNKKVTVKKQDPADIKNIIKGLILQIQQHDKYFKKLNDENIAKIKSLANQNLLEFEENSWGSLFAIYSSRPDLQKSFPEATKEDYFNLLSWAVGTEFDKIGNSSETSLIKKHRDFYRKELDKLHNLNAMKQKDTLLEQQASQLNQKDTLLEQQATQLNQKDTLLEQQATQLNQKDTLLEQQATQLNQKDTLLEQQASQLNQKDTLLEQQATQLEHLLKESRQYERTIMDLKMISEEQSNKFDILEEEIQNYKVKESLIANELNSVYNSALFNLTRRIATVLDKTCPPNTLLGRALRKTAYPFYRKGNYTHTLTIMPTDFHYGYEFDDFIDEKTRSTMIESFDTKPIISIIMPVYNTQPLLLKKAIISVKKQYYSNWQLCICDDGSSNSAIHQILKKESSIDDRISVIYSSKNEGISSASNKALSLATGEYTLLLDHDDELARNALLEVVNAINKDKEIDFIYSDEDKLDQKGIHIDPFFKPDWSPDLLFSYNYTIHLSVYQTSKLKEIGGFRNGFEGSQDYDLNLRYLEHARKIFHIPKVLYSWRKSPGSTALNLSEKNYAFAAGKNALTETLQRRKIDAKCEDGIQPGTYSIKYRIKEKPLITIIIPTRTFQNLKKCIKSIVEKSTYKNIEIIVMDSSKDFQIKKLCENMPQVRYESVYMQKFNFSKVNNDAVQKSNGKYVIFLNDDTEVITPGWMEALLEHAQRDEIGIVGAKLLYPDGRIQHAGTVIGIQYHGGNYGNVSENDDGYFSYPKIIRNCCAVTAACMMMKKDFFNKLGGYDEKLAKSWQDVDLCIRVIRSSKLIIYTPYSVLYHYEGGTRGAVDISGEELEARRLFREKNLDFIERGDPYYNPNLSMAIPFRIVKNYIKPIRVLADLYELRRDLREAFPNEQKNNFKTLIDWAATSGILTDSRRDILQQHYDFYFENSSKEAKPLAMIVKQYLENEELQKKFPEALTGKLDSLLKFMNKPTY